MFSRNAQDGRLTFGQILRDDDYNFLERANAIAMSPDGKHVYVTSDQKRILAVFERSLNGHLALVEVYRDNVYDVIGLSQPFDLTVSPDGRHVYVTSDWKNILAIFERNPDDGTLTFIETVKDEVADVSGLGPPNDLVMSSDGLFIYSTSGSKPVMVFSRDPDSGKLSFVQALTAGENSFDSLWRAESVVISPDGANIYVADRTTRSLAVYSRNQSDGTLSPVEIFDNIDSAWKVVISPDGQYVYLALDYHTGILLFRRNLEDGTLTYLETFPHHAVEMTLSPDSSVLYALVSDSMLVFERDMVDGTLSLVQQFNDEENGIESLALTQGVAVSPNNYHVYVVSFDDEAVSVFSTPAGLNPVREVYLPLIVK